MRTDKIGDTVKVFLPGERPWAEIIEIDDSRIKARLITKFFHEFSEHEQAQWMNQHFGTVEPLPKLHDYKQGDELWFCKNERDEWVPDVA